MPGQTPSFPEKPGFGDYLAQYSHTSLSKSVRFLVQGPAWPNPDNHQIMRMRTGMRSPRQDVILNEQITGAVYESVELDDGRRKFWPPREVNVSWELTGWINRNRHKYSDYHLFAVQSDCKITQPQIKWRTRLFVDFPAKTGYGRTSSGCGRTGRSRMSAERSEYPGTFASIRKHPAKNSPLACCIIWNHGPKAGT